MQSDALGTKVHPGGSGPSSRFPYGGFRKWGYPNCWLVYNGQSHSKMDDLGVAPILGNPHMDMAGHLSFFPNNKLP